ncbi:MAG: AAA family ATPase, partial [Actinobacteria bacterium]|nr:AAA family ATPase [Actinomycetota bacterium]
MGAYAAEADGRAEGGPAAVRTPLTPLIGRARETQVLTETLGKCRLVTITGPGGAGKTRLALEVIARRQRRPSGGTWLVDLTAAPETPDVAGEIARILDVLAPSGGSTTDALIRYLAGRDALLVLDNCEHVIETCAQLTSHLLTCCPALRVLATSREALGVEGEVVWTLSPLAADDAHRLFVERARQRKPEFVPTTDDDAAIDRLCTRLDRLPLAIELAAARVRIMSPAEILVALDARLDDLGGGRRASPARHRSVRAAVEWSYQLLAPEEQRAFRALSVFVGGFDAAAASSVAGGLSLSML